MPTAGQPPSASGSVWVLNLCALAAWAEGALSSLRSAGVNLDAVDAPPAGPAAGIILAGTYSSELRGALATADLHQSRALVLCPDNANVDPWEVLESGASECVVWNGQAAAVAAWLERVQEVEAILNVPDVRGQFVGTSRALRLALRDLVVAARFGKAPVLILGETGTGKELAAKAAHAVSRRNGGLVVVDCTTIVPTLMGSELFGHERGAFTGAVNVRTGACSAADNGSLFLDEIGELPLDLQSELLRVVQEGTYKRVGGDRWLHSSFRLISATNRDLKNEVDGGRFRADLYHRIAAATVTMPPLRDRAEDILPLFVRFCRESMGVGEDPQVDPAVRDVLLHRAYPGNLRDLRQLAARVAARHVGPGAITPGDLPLEDRPVSLSRPVLVLGAALVPGPTDTGNPLRDAAAWALDQGLGLQLIKDGTADAAVDVALERCKGNLHSAASLLGVSDRAVQLRQARRTSSPGV